MLTSELEELDLN